MTIKIDRRERQVRRLCMLDESLDARPEPPNNTPDIAPEPACCTEALLWTPPLAKLLSMPFVIKEPSDEVLLRLQATHNGQDTRLGYQILIEAGIKRKD